MIEDVLQELTANAGVGQAMTDDAYGSTPLDLGVKGGEIVIDPAVGEPLYAMYQAMTDAAGMTSVAISIVNDTNGAGGSEVELVTTGTVLAAALTIAAGAQVIGIIKPGLITKRYLTAKCAFSDNGTVTFRVWLQKGAYVIPANAGAM